MTALPGWTLVIIKSRVSIGVGHSHWWFNYGWCPNLNLREISESESEANNTYPPRTTGVLSENSCCLRYLRYLWTQVRIFFEAFLNILTCFPLLNSKNLIWNVLTAVADPGSLHGLLTKYFVNIFQNPMKLKTIWLGQSKICHWSGI